MCGIAGIIRLDDIPPDASDVRAMTAALAHRGPDGEGLAELGPAVLGHRRLAVLDLSAAGAQPMRDRSGRYHITFNGEIYNYVELRAELVARGVEFRSQTDTEVLLEGYALWGAGVLEKLNGMFAFAIWDTRENALFAARDRFGEKPLFYMHEPRRELRFASEIKAFRATGARTSFDPQVLFRYLAYRQTGTRENTFFTEIMQVPPASVLIVRNGRVDVRPYWSLASDPEPSRGFDDDRVAKVAELLAESVRLRVRSDVRVGACLSGGIDSSAIVALVARGMEQGQLGPATARQLTFSASFPDSPREEIEHARVVAFATGVEAHETVPTPEDLLATLPALIRSQDEPFSGPSIFAEWKVMQLARDHGVTVLLNGQGADEVFAGYPFYFSDLWYGQLRRGRFARMRTSMAAFDDEAGAGASRALLNDGLRSRIPHALRELRGGPRLPWLHPDFIASVETRPPERPFDLRGSLRESQEFRMLPHLLRQADRNAMAFSREARLPFLDHRLVEYVDGLPDDLKLRGALTKWVLREAVRDLVPASILARRDKVGFAVPMREWMRGALAVPIRETLTSDRLRERGLFDPVGLPDALAQLEGGDDSAVPIVWNAWIAETWLRACVDDTA